MRHTLTFTAVTAAMLVSTAAYADNMKVSSEASIQSLPDKGAVNLSGTVDRVVDGDTFVLRDNAGDTIDVHTASNVTVHKGDVVSVKGEKTAEMAGMGEEIENASVSVTDAIEQTASAASGAAQQYEPNASARASIQANADALNAENTASPHQASDNTEAKNTASYNLGASVDRMAAAGKEAADDAANAVSNTAESVTASASSLTNDSIENLPKEGAVELNGVVAEVDSDQEFTLRDATGRTIDIHTASNVEVQPGDTVSVNGNVKSKLLGLGREIESAKVLVVSAAE
jgi:uncharacterized protein YdeI (BOF family)